MWVNLNLNVSLWRQHRWCCESVLGLPALMSPNCHFFCLFPTWLGGFPCTSEVSLFPPSQTCLASRWGICQFWARIPGRLAHFPSPLLLLCDHCESTGGRTCGKVRCLEQSWATPGIPAEAILDPPTTPSQGQHSLPPDPPLATEVEKTPAEPRNTAQLTCKLEGSVNAYRFKTPTWG